MTNNSNVTIFDCRINLSTKRDKNNHMSEAFQSVKNLLDEAPNRVVSLRHGPLTKDEMEQLRQYAFNIRNCKISISKYVTVIEPVLPYNQFSYSSLKSILDKPIKVYEYVDFTEHDYKTYFYK